MLSYTLAMFIKLTRSGARTYAQLVESFRDEQGKPRQRTVATLGRIDEQDGQVDALLNGLLRAKGRPAASNDTAAGRALNRRVELHPDRN